MAGASLKVCNAPGCRAISDQSKCEKHRTQRTKDSRENAAKRGYDYQWQKLRARFVKSHPLCEDCLAQGRTTAANEAHHVEKVADAPERRLDASNLMALCKRCHAARTAKGE